MSSEHLGRYRLLLNQLIFEREAAGGELPEEQESLFVERLDAIWWQLTADEQATMDGELAQSPAPTVAGELNLVDCEVTTGSHSAPRKAA